MHSRDIIVIGASAGGVTALQNLVRSMPLDYQGSVFVVLHIPAYTKSRLAEILTAAGPLQAVYAEDGEKVMPGKIYVASNDHHLLLEGNKVLVKKGPKENRFRPSVDALFRSAAAEYGARVVGIVLSGVLNDGTSGLWAIKRQGGIAIIQSADDAEHMEMPQNTLEYVEVDYQVPAYEIGPLLQKLVTEAAPDRFKLSEKEWKLLNMEVIIARKDGAFELGIIEMGEFTPFTCPECHGSLVKLEEGNLIRFRCHTGHAYTSSSLLASITESVEEILWQGMRGMEEASILLRNIADHFEKTNNDRAATLFRKKAEGTSKRARVIHDSVFEQEQFSEDLRFEDE